MAGLSNPQIDHETCPVELWPESPKFPLGKLGWIIIFQRPILDQSDPGYLNEFEEASEHIRSSMHMKEGCKPTTAPRKSLDH